VTPTAVEIKLTVSKSLLEDEPTPALIELLGEAAFEAGRRQIQKES
jgi:hypothetical protein